MPIYSSIGTRLLKFKQSQFTFAPIPDFDIQIEREGEGEREAQYHRFPFKKASID